MARLRFIQALLLTIAITGGVRAWRMLAEPQPDKLRALAEAPLKRIFGPDVTYDWPFEVDFERGVEIRNLRVPALGEQALVTDADGTEHPRYGLEADRVTIRHDLIALAAGRHVPLRLELRGARILARETAEGVVLDFPLDVSSDGHAAGKLPEIDVQDVELIFHAGPESERLRPGSKLHLVVDQLSLTPHEGAPTVVKAEARTLGLGQDETVIELSGWIEEAGESFELVAEWDPLQLTPELLDALAEEIASPLRQRSIQSGRMILKLSRSGDKEAGAIQPRLEWDSDVQIKVEDLPFPDSIDNATKEQLQQLFGGAAFSLTAGDGRVDITSLVAELAGGRVSASGWVMSETGAFRINFEIQDLRLEDPEVRKALGEDGAELFAEFRPRGVVDAFGHVTRSADGTVEWSVDVLLEDATLMYVGSIGENGRREGFPYEISDVTGHVRIRPNGVEFDDIVGFHRGAEVTILGYEKREAWSGGETGRIRFTDDGADVRLTIIATDVPMDADLIAAIQGSEFSDMLETFQLDGVVDKIELDLIKIPAIERTVKTEMRLTLLGEEFVYLDFPLPLEDVAGTVIMRRPVIGKERGRTYAFDVTGWAEGAAIRIQAESVEHESRGRMTVTADGLPLAGAVTQAVLTAPATAESLGEAWRWLAPRGKARLDIDLPLGDDPGPMHLDALLQGASIRLNAEGDAPLEIADLQGRLEVRDGGVHLHGLTGTLGEAPVTLHGSMLGGVEGTWDIQARIENLRLTPSLGRSLAALTDGGNLLPGGMRFEAGSRMSFDLHLRRAAGDEAELEIDLVATDLDTVIRLSDGSNLAFSGERLEVRGNVLRAQNLRAESEGLRVVVPHAEVRLGGDDTELVGQFEVAMDHLRLPENLLELLPSGMREFLVEWTKDRTLRSKSLRVSAPQGGPITLRGDLMFEVPPDTPVGDGPRGALAFDPLVLDTRGEATSVRGLIHLHGFSMDVGLEVEDLDGRIEIEELRLGEVPRGRGRVVALTGRMEGLSVAGITAPLDWSENILRIPAIEGRVAGGVVAGRLLMHTAEPLSYEGALTVEDFDLSLLREDLAPTGPDFSGLGRLHVTFQNRGGDMRDLTAEGSLHVRKGNLGDLPVVANIFALADELFQSEQRLKFERADVHFVLEREVLKFSRADLSGPLFDMPGRGSLDLAGTIDLRFTPDFIKSLILPGVMQIPLLGDVLHGVLREELFYAVLVRGDLGDPETEIEFLPPLELSNRRKFSGTGSRKLPKRKLPGWFR